MDSPPKKNTQENETPTSKSRLKASSSCSPETEVRVDTGVEMPTILPDLNNEPQSSDYEGVSLSHLCRRSLSLDFEMPDSKQTLIKNNTSVCESSWRCVVPSTSLHLNAFAMSSKQKRVKLNPDEGESCKRCNCKKCLKLYNDTQDDSSKTPARPNSACYCKKSNCKLKFCGCYKGGVRCSINCLCEGCLNKFGRKDG